MFKRESVIASDWYAERLKNKQQIDVRLMEEMVENLQAFIANPINASVITEFRYDERLEKAKETLAYYRSDEYLEALVGTIGAASMAL
jgi:3-mercaptopyruvate sulfurtransferase SseA